MQFYDPKVAVIGLVCAGERVLLIRRGVDPAKGKWSLPGGYMDAGEMPTEALQRELLEEAGLAIVVDHFLDIYPIARSKRITGGIVIAYQASPREPGAPKLNVCDDADDAAWFKADELPDDIAFDSTIELLARWRDGKLPQSLTEHRSAE